ncbi:hypothetical protein [Marinobacter xestospongiae]|uniref:hypothetical protein n=1 Tax=Marinobacter xestospongiae TaxID=994319 RepID=UPI002004481D|nr:hypothetical protein [Marinobacter xestospongiae]
MKLIHFFERVRTLYFDGSVLVESGNIYSLPESKPHIHMAADVGRNFHSWVLHGSGTVSCGYDSYKIKGGDVYSLISKDKLFSYDLYPPEDIGDFQLIPSPVKGNEFRSELVKDNGKKVETRSAAYLSSDSIVAFNKKARRGPITLSCMNLELNILWENEDYKYVTHNSHRLDYSGFECIGDTFIFVAGSYRNQIVALDRSTGTEVWSYQVDESCADHHLIREDLIVVLKSNNKCSTTRW